MRILAVLWTVCLVRLCSAGCFGCFGKGKTNDRVTVQAVQGGSREASRDNLRSPPQKPVEFPTGPQTQARSASISSQSTSSEVGDVDTESAHTSNSIGQGTNTTQVKGTNSEVDEEQHSYGASQSSGNSSRSPQNPRPQTETALASTPPLANTTSSITSQAGAPKPTTPITLDLAKPDETNVRVGNQSRDDGIKTKRFTPKDAFHISSVVDGGSSVWKAEKNERCKFVESHAKGDSSLISIGISKGDYLDFKYFEKTADGKWNNITQGDFLRKLAGMRKSGSSPNPSSSHPSPTTTPSQ
ncbi:signal peptide containing protein [Theileria equi strain WA]|uniref:Signal peptide containing protein n=1 Tax=Theileria equi strain WA TaxID=1537102 RepID=L1LCE5_THEEQ|nr:signal peptide containing protein [Theileria equi strain WA]EKX73016.1 signal peptide containing protein [Theileria equi strain WA]|eukprot:XP_004832468.1 signal peptide containing protein [Theileria equi strain WA]